MKEHGIYFGKEAFYDKIRAIGGAWNDSKERPIVCLIKSSQYENIYWAIPLGNWNHRNEEAKKRIYTYMNFDNSDIRSCFYHVGNTDMKSIFFISDAVPITDEYIEREYIETHSKSHYIIKNKKLLEELERKLSRILAWEKAKPNYFRQHITDLVNALVNDIEQQ